MAKTGTTKKQKPKPKLTDKEQSERFIKTARKLGVSLDREVFEDTFSKIVSKKRGPSRPTS